MRNGGIQAFSSLQNTPSVINITETRMRNGGIQAFSSLQNTPSVINITETLNGTAAIQLGMDKILVILQEPQTNKIACRGKSKTAVEVTLNFFLQKSSNMTNF
jgi:hypothetical protein